MILWAINPTIFDVPSRFNSIIVDGLEISPMECVYQSLNGIPVYSSVYGALAQNPEENHDFYSLFVHLPGRGRECLLDALSGAECLSAAMFVNDYLEKLGKPMLPIEFMA